MLVCCYKKQNKTPPHLEAYLVVLQGQDVLLSSSTFDISSFSIMLKSQLNYGLWHGSILYTTAFHKTNEQGHWGSLSILSLKSIYVLGSIFKNILFQHKADLLFYKAMENEGKEAFAVPLYYLLVKKGVTEVTGFFSPHLQWEILL